MSTATNFSRLQLAAALLEYDNDPEDPSHPQRNARESAIFAPLRRPPKVPLGHDNYEDMRNLPDSRRNTGLLSVMLPSDTLAQGNHRSSTMPPHAKLTKAPMGQDEEMLSSWGLEGFAPKEGDTEKTQQSPVDGGDLGRSISHRLTNPFDPLSPSTSSIKRFPLNRPLSTGDMDVLAATNTVPDKPSAAPKVINYRHSMANELDFAKALTSSGSLTQEQVLFPRTGSPTQDAEGDGTPLPSSARTSRFDPRAVGAQQRRYSTASMGSRGLLDAPNSRMRTVSNGSMSTRMMIDGDGNSFMSPDPYANEDQHRQLSRLELMRPKVLVMPVPLQSQNKPGITKKPLREGFFDSTDNPPLPPGSRPDARPGPRPLTSFNSDGSINLRTSMSLSQLTFRQTLMVGGERDVSYVDIDHSLRRAEQDGERIEKDWSDEEEEKELRPAGKLYGASLMDTLEARKAEMKGKQRVFKGDERPSMMQRHTFVDPEALKRPASQFPGATDSPAARASTLITLNDAPRTAPGPGIPAARSVFGVDKIWERELAKLKDIEAAEQAEKAKLDALEAKIAAKKAGKGKSSPAAAGLAAAGPSKKTNSPLLRIPPVGTGISPLQAIGQLEVAKSGSDSEEDVPRRRGSTVTLGARGWFAGSDEGSDDGGPPSGPASRRPSFRRKVSAQPALPQIRRGTAESDEDEDIPLAAKIARKSHLPPARPVESDSDEDKPISALIQQKSPIKKKQGDSGVGGALPSLNFDLGSPLASKVELKSPTKKPAAAAESSDEDEVPLGLRHPGVTVPAPGADDDDDQPLGMRASVAPGQLSAAQQQQYFMAMQQHQMMLQAQAQMRTSMAMGMMGSGFGPAGMMGSNMSMHSMGAPAMMGVPPLAAQPGYTRVDKWRREVSNKSGA